MLNVLFLSHRIPYPPDKGEKIRSFHWLAHLARRGNVDLLTHADDVRELRHGQVLADMCRDVRILPLNPMVSRLRAAGALVRGRPMSAAWLTRPHGARIARSWLAERDYDLIFAFSSQMGAYLKGPLPAPLVMDMCDVDSEKFLAYARKGGFVKRLIYFLEGRRLNRLERHVGRLAARVLLATPNECRLFEERVGTGPCEAMTNGVPRPAGVPPHSERDQDLMVFIGTMSYPANTRAAIRGARDILPIVRRQRPGARFRIVGRSPSREVQALAQLPGVEVTGGVAAVRPHLEEASVALVPLEIARGIQNKVLEALAHGLPVVATPGVGDCMEPGGEGAFAWGATDEELAAQVLNLMADPEARQRRSEAARAYVAEHYDWDGIDARLDHLLDGIVRPPMVAEPCP